MLKIKWKTYFYVQAQTYGLPTWRSTVFTRYKWKIKAFISFTFDFERVE